MHTANCEKCWEQSEKAKWLEEKSNQRLSEWSDFLTEIPLNSRLSNGCIDYLRNFVMEVLSESRKGPFKFKEWHTFTNESAERNDAAFVEVGLFNMEETAETNEEKRCSQNVNAYMQKRFELSGLRLSIIHA
ncbi:MAG: hypothetical protein HYR95_02660 [Candidatus Colwellbacteria bacterium]|nr:hypothetical protein [Candidatus Colwellbacteria bacterium]